MFSFGYNCTLGRLPGPFSDGLDLRPRHFGGEPHIRRRRQDTTNRHTDGHTDGQLGQPPDH